MDIKKLLGLRIKEIRKARHLTQEQVAERIGVEPASLSNIENGKYYPTAENLDKILQVLDLTPSELFKIEHLQNDQTLIDEINKMLKSNPDKIKYFYNIAKGLCN